MLNTTPFCGYTTFVYLAVDGYMVYFQILAVRDNAAMNFQIHGFVWVCFPLS